MISAASGFVAGLFLQKFFPAIGDIIVAKTQSAYKGIVGVFSKPTTPPSN